MTKKEIAVNAVHALKKEYPDAICSLVYTDPLQLLIATRLAAQCTDARVNMVTPSLFDRFKTVQDFADSTPEEVAEYIKSCGLYKTKSKYITSLLNRSICCFINCFNKALDTARLNITSNNKITLIFMQKEKSLINRPINKNIKPKQNAATNKE